MQDRLMLLGREREGRREVRRWKERWGALGWPRRDRGTARPCVCARAPLHRVEMPCTSGQQDRAEDARGASQGPALGTAAMTENSDKVPIALVGPDDVEFCSPPVSTAREPQNAGSGSPVLGQRFVPPNLGGGSKLRCPNVGLGGAPRVCLCRGAGIPRGCEGARVRRERRVAGGEPRGDVPAPRKVCPGHIHARGPGTLGRELSERGAGRSLG